MDGRMEVTRSNKKKRINQNREETEVLEALTNRQTHIGLGPSVVVTVSPIATMTYNSTFEETGYTL